VLPVFATGQADLIGDEHAVASNISIEPAHGHTPGQMQVRVGGPREAVLCADLMHHPLQIRYPEWSTKFCIDADQARATRQAFLRQHANSGRVIFPAHFPSPTGCTIERDGASYSFAFDGEG
jgi:glyoxylase-like metal-dependent hydrolase (beta-lactamase superfamily II)